MVNLCLICRPAEHDSLVLSASEPSPHRRPDFNSEDDASQSGKHASFKGKENLLGSASRGTDSKGSSDPRAGDQPSSKDSNKQLGSAQTTSPEKASAELKGPDASAAAVPDCNQHPNTALQPPDPGLLKGLQATSQTSLRIANKADSGSRPESCNGIVNPQDDLAPPKSWQGGASQIEIESTAKELAWARGINVDGELTQRLRMKLAELAAAKGNEQRGTSPGNEAGQDLLKGAKSGFMTKPDDSLELDIADDEAEPSPPLQWNLQLIRGSEGNSALSPCLSLNLCVLR